MKKKKKINPLKYNKYFLYENSVQSPELEISFINRVFKNLRGRRPISIKEDFCATASFCCEWVMKSPKNKAYGVDLDQVPLKWALKYQLIKLQPDEVKRIDLRLANVLDRFKPAVDVVTALNFSYFIFKKREVLKAYFKNVYRTLN